MPEWSPRVTCQELVAGLLSHLDGERPGAQQSRFREHLTQCPDCVAYLATYQTAVRLGRAVCTCGDDIPTDVSEELVRTILAARATDRSV
jgi:anti-sigma factor RsiW